MSFIPKQVDEGKVVRLPATSATAYTKHDGVKFTSGYLAATASGDASVDLVSLETVTSATGNGSTFIKCLRVDPSMVFHATCSTTLVQATHVGNRYDISAAGTVDLGATTDKVFLIERIVSSTVAEGRFMQAIA